MPDQDEALATAAAALSEARQSIEKAAEALDLELAEPKPAEPSMNERMRAGRGQPGPGEKAA